MPTVTLPNGKKKIFPYNAVGKAQASSYANMNKGKVNNPMNPNYGSEKSMKKSEIDFDTMAKKDKTNKDPNLLKAELVQKVGGMAAMGIGLIGHKGKK